MKLTLIRHAQSVRNKIVKGGHSYTDVSQKLGIPNHLIKITDLGEIQAKEVAKKLFQTSLMKGKGLPSVLLHSGYERARTTAEIILKEVKVFGEENNISVKTTIEQDHLIRERDSGYGIEMTHDESRGHFPFLEEHWALNGAWFSVPPGGESVVQVMDRVSTFLLKLAMNKDLEGKHVWAVCHARTMSAFQMVVEKIPFEKADELVLHPKNCATAEYELEYGVWKSVKE
jgi:broad specificity phosphatase PhoE